MGIPGMVVEGFAVASVHEHEYLPMYIFEPSDATAIEAATTRLASLSLNTKTSTAHSQLEQLSRTHAFSILAKIKQDSKFVSKEIKKHFKGFDGLISGYGDTIWRSAQQWTIDPSQQGEIERKMEEYIWTSTIIYSTDG